jgi:hypothetical protein
VAWQSVDRQREALKKISMGAMAQLNWPMAFVLLEFACHFCPADYTGKKRRFKATCREDSLGIFVGEYSDGKWSVRKNRSNPHSKS